MLPLYLQTKRLQQDLRHSIERRYKNKLSNDWLPPEKASSFPVDKFYVQLEWTKIDKGVMKNTRKRLRNIYDLLNVDVTRAVSVLVKGLCFKS